MRNLMTFTNPLKAFPEEYAGLVRVQIDLLLRRWKLEDIMLVTNFPYEYNGVKSIIVPDNLHCEHHRRASKINEIIYLLENKMVDEVCWFHDFDAFQLEDIPEDILEDKDAAFTTYGFNENWNTGSFFFIPKALDIFKMIKETMDRKRINEEQALCRLTQANKANINDRYVTLNPTYNLGQKWSSELVYDMADKPIRVLHFHPAQKEVYERVKPIIPDYLMEIFKKHGY